jgi:hypothetical protein
MNVEKTVAPVLPLHSNRRIAVSRAIDIRVNIDPVHWFLSPAKDTRSSLYLEDAATEFQVQGLELDWTIVTWDADLRWSGDGWSYHSFRGAKWTDVKKPERRQYLKNAYRVLLTWARQGMVIFVPPGAKRVGRKSPARNLLCVARGQCSLAA